MTEFQVVENRGGDALKVTFSDSTLPPAEVPEKFVPNWAFAIGLAIIKNRDLAVECGMPGDTIDTLKDLGIPGAQALGKFLMRRSGMKDGWPGPAAGETFELSLDKPRSSDKLMSESQDRSDDDIELTFSDGTFTAVRVPIETESNWPLAIGHVIIENPELAVECGMSEDILNACKDLGFPGAEVLGKILMLSAEMPYNWPGPDLGETFELPLDQTFSADMRYPGPEKKFLSRHNLTEFLE